MFIRILLTLCLLGCVFLMFSAASVKASNIQKVNLAGGCFWGVEAGLQKVHGVKTVVGYTGGHTDKPTYSSVCSGSTGHTEAVQVSYDETEVGLETILAAFWKMNAPAFPGNQTGQYRSAVFCYTPAQIKVAKLSLANFEHKSARRVYTAILPAEKFYEAEDYHQNYYRKHGDASCSK